MKKTICSLLALLALAGSATAQNALTINDITVPQNDAATLTVSSQFDMDETYTGYSFNISLPAELAFDMEEGTDVACTKGSCHDASHSVTANLSEGMVKVAGLSLSSKPLSGTEGVLLEFTVRPATELAVGQTFDGMIKDILIVDTNGVKQSLPEATFTVAIGEPVDDRVLLDEHATTLPTARTAADVCVRRTMRADEWTTICLPFAMTQAQIADAFGSGAVVADFKGADTEFNDNDDVLSIRANFASVTAMEANRPYIVKPAVDVEEFLVDGVDLVPNEDEANVEYDNGKQGSRRVVLSGLYGTLHAGTAVDDESLVLQDGAFSYSDGTATLNAFSAYFYFCDPLADRTEAADRIVLVVDGQNVTTALGTALRQQSASGQAHDLQGRRINDSVRPGLYIVDGRKVVK